MSIEKIRQLAKTLVEASYEYSSLAEKKSPKSEVDRLRAYMLNLSLEMKRLISEELKNA